MTGQKKILILADNLVGGGAILASTVLAELCENANIMEIRGWLSPKVEIPAANKFGKIQPVGPLKYLPKWIQRAWIARQFKKGWTILNFTNFPVSRLGVNRGVVELCLFHNAYFMATPQGNHGPISGYFYFREIFMRRFLLRWLMLFFSPEKSKIIVQSNYMKKLSLKSIFKKRVVHVAAVHKPPLTEEGPLSPKLLGMEIDFANSWFYPATADPHKNHRILVEICKKAVARGENPKIVLTVSPRNQEERSLLSTIKELGLESNLINVGWIGPGERQHIYNLCKGILFLSEFESLGIPLLEARMSKKPLLCAMSPIAREILGDDFPLYHLSQDEDLHKFSIELTNKNSLVAPPPLKNPSLISDAYFLDFLDK